MKKYLSQEVKSRIKHETPELIPGVQSVLKNWSNNSYIWIPIFLFTLIIFYLGHNINIELLNIIHIDNNNIKQMVENRTTNIIAIIGISFAIVGFLISNLAIKGNKSYDILFRRSFFLPITFFSLLNGFIYYAYSIKRPYWNRHIISDLVCRHIFDSSFASSTF